MALNALSSVLFLLRHNDIANTINFADATLLLPARVTGSIARRP